MIIEISDDSSMVKWKMNDNEDWKSAEISDLIKAYESPKVTVFAENASKEEIEDFKQELENVLERPQGDIFTNEIVAGKCPIEAGGNCPLKSPSEWIAREDMDYIDENKVVHKHFECKECGLIHDFIDGHTSQYNFCPQCGARMHNGGAV